MSKPRQLHAFFLTRAQDNAPSPPLPLPILHLPLHCPLHFGPRFHSKKRATSLNLGCSSCLLCLAPVSILDLLLD